MRQKKTTKRKMGVGVADLEAGALSSTFFLSHLFQSFLPLLSTAVSLSQGSDNDADNDFNEDLFL